MSGLLVVAYLVAGVLFIRSLGGLSKQETASQGNVFGIVGMVLAIVVTALNWGNLGDLASRTTGIGLLLGTAVIGGAIGAVLAKRVEMTGMPELVAVLHSFVGLAAVLVGFSSYLHPLEAPQSDVHHLVHQVEIWVGIAVGAITFTGSIVANLKLSAKISSAPLVLPGKNYINLGALALFVILTIWFVASPALWLLIAVTI
ncbi:MAG TPA: NAD(P)(+) transhydrogenase (Re/Si-specific) subunit beta, partial [Archangium sp.]